MKQSTVARLQRIENMRGIKGLITRMSDDELFLLLRQGIQEDGGTRPAAASARVERDEALAQIIEAMDGCRNGAELMGRIDTLIKEGQLATPYRQG
jgi:hypothetical protein